MSEFFIKTFNKNTGCAHCKSGKLRVGKKTYSLCEAHLNKAAEKWRNWADYRRQQGLCISCNHKSFNGWLRCRAHTNQNRAKCKSWMKDNGPEHYARQKQRKELFLAQGICFCPARNPTAGFRRCADCRTRSNSYGKRA